VVVKVPLMWEERTEMARLVAAMREIAWQSSS